MTTRFLTLIIACMLTAAWTGTAAAALPTLGAAEGVTATRGGGRIEIRLAGAAAAAAQRYVGHELMVSCERHPAPGLLFGADEIGGSTATSAVVRRTADGALSLNTLLQGDPDGDVCLVARDARPRVVGHEGPFRLVAGGRRPPLARVAMTPEGAAWIDELGHVAALSAAWRKLSPGATYPLPAAAAASMGLVALDGPGATPPPGAVGYWSDGAARATFVTLSAAGRRLVVEDLGGGMGRSNVDPFTSDISAMLDEDRSYEVETDDLDRGRSPVQGKLPLDAGDGVRARLAGRVLTVRFGGRSAKTLRALAGRRLGVTCAATPPSGRVTSAQSFTDAFQHVVVRVPRRGDTLRIGLRRAGRADLCAIDDDGNSVASFEPTAAGRAIFADFAALGPLFDLEDLAPAGAAAYPPAATLAAQHPRSLVALSGPGAFPPAGRRAGVWTAGDQLVLSVTSTTGHHFVLADEGNGVRRSNVDTLLLWIIGLG